MKLNHPYLFGTICRFHKHIPAHLPHHDQLIPSLQRTPPILDFRPSQLLLKHDWCPLPCFGIHNFNHMKKRPGS
ncbi:hypothetical protein K1719_025916 [Acacia pycnantha]|nr:hypothetical protein K1719_025916 [Acacia pycnantha]